MCVELLAGIVLDFEWNMIFKKDDIQHSLPHTACSAYAAQVVLNLYVSAVNCFARVWSLWTCLCRCIVCPLGAAFLSVSLCLLSHVDFFEFYLSPLMCQRVFGLFLVLFDLWFCLGFCLVFGFP